MFVRRSMFFPKHSGVTVSKRLLRGLEEAGTGQSCRNGPSAPLISPLVKEKGNELV